MRVFASRMVASTSRGSNDRRQADGNIAQPPEYPESRVGQWNRQWNRHYAMQRLDFIICEKKACEGLMDDTCIDSDVTLEDCHVAILECGRDFTMGTQCCECH